MAVKSDLALKRERFMARNGADPEVVDLWDQWLAFLAEPALAKLVDLGPVLKGGYLAIPESDRHHPVLRGAGHDPAVAEVLPRANGWLAMFRRGIGLSNYLALVTCITGLLYRTDAPFSTDQIERLYSTLDRLLRGGTDWRSLQSVPAATKEFYRTLGGVNVLTAGVDISGDLCEFSRAHLQERFGRDGYEATSLLALSMEVFAVAAAVRNGRTKADRADDIESVRVLLSLFDTDLYSLPLVIREGRSGYELLE